MLLTKNGRLSGLLLFAARLTVLLAAPVQANLETYHVLDHGAEDNSLAPPYAPLMQDLLQGKDIRDLLADMTYAPEEYNWEHEDNIMEHIWNLSHSVPHLFQNIRDHAARRLHGIVDNIEKQLTHHGDPISKKPVADGGDSIKFIAPTTSSGPASNLPVHGNTIPTLSTILQGEGQLNVTITMVITFNDPAEVTDS